ncbi:hypothetical protein NUSPORA_01531 [Nucleospora cyclopteri]
MDEELLKCVCDSYIKVINEIKSVKDDFNTRMTFLVDKVEEVANKIDKLEAVKRKTNKKVQNKSILQIKYDNNYNVFKSSLEESENKEISKDNSIKLIKKPKINQKEINIPSSQPAPKKQKTQKKTASLTLKKKSTYVKPINSKPQLPVEKVQNYEKCDIFKLLETEINN